uniref:Calcineurin B homologous protein 1-like n=1 Tax=Ciona intestinalis TaxID=7719 RepID=H2Y1V5_CIOIN|nr:calcineurin B homologous protein 1-like [Ciona intestinalis]|eukprot:XP_002128696.1 calcineurin B homologous protein 1-like [Ciona intestinalis]
MGSKASLHLREEEIEAIQQETGFQSNQIIRLFSRFTCLDKEQNGFLTRDDFMRIPELAINPLADRIVDAFFNGGEEHVNFRQFMRTLANFRPSSAKTAEDSPNSRTNKLKFVFSLYDYDSDGMISKKELLQILKLLVGANINQDQLSHIAERTLLESDTNNDRHISFEEFKTVMARTEIDTKMSVRFLD